MLWTKEDQEKRDLVVRYYNALDAIQDQEKGISYYEDLLSMRVDDSVNGNKEETITTQESREFTKEVNAHKLTLVSKNSIKQELQQKYKELYVSSIDDDIALSEEITPGGVNFTEIILQDRQNKNLIKNALIFSKGNPIYCKNNSFQSLFRHAVEKDYIELMEWLLASQKSNILNNHDTNGMTLFHLACHDSHKEIVKLLLDDKRIDVNKADNDRDTPFSVACAFNHLEIVKLLLDDKRIDVNMANNKGDTPLSLACAFNHLEIVKLLLDDKRIDVNMADNEGMTPLHFACNDSHKEIVKLLLADDKLKLNMANNNGETPFSVACAFNHLEIVKLLLDDKRIDVNKADNEGMTPFYWACNENHLEIVKLLLDDKRIDVNMANNEGETPFSLACDLGHTDIVEAFLESGKLGEKDKKIAQKYLNNTTPTPKKIESLLRRGSLKEQNKNSAPLGQNTVDAIIKNYDECKALSNKTLPEIISDNSSSDESKAISDESKAMIGIAYNKLVTFGNKYSNNSNNQDRKKYSDLKAPDAKLTWQPVIRAIKTELETKLSELNSACSKEPAPDTYLGLGIVINSDENGKLSIASLPKAIDCKNIDQNAKININGVLIENLDQLLAARNSFKLGVPVKVLIVEGDKVEYERDIMPVLITKNKNNTLERHDAIFEQEVKAVYSAQQAQQTHRN